MTDTSPRTPCSNRSARKRVPLIGTKATADFHQGAQPPCCNPDAVYMAAAEIMPASTDTPLPRGSHPYMVRATMASGISLSETTVGRELRALGYRKISARPRHFAQNRLAIDAFKKTFRPDWTRSAKGSRPEPR